jgi:hypothetical protein
MAIYNLIEWIADYAALGIEWVMRFVQRRHWWIWGAVAALYGIGTILRYT